MNRPPVALLNFSIRPPIGSASVAPTGTPIQKACCWVAGSVPCAAASSNCSVPCAPDPMRAVVVIGALTAAPPIPPARNAVMLPNARGSTEAMNSFCLAGSVGNAFAAMSWTAWPIL